MGSEADRALLDRFVAQRDEAAFTELVSRHGALVMGVCRRILGNVQDSEDAFQATFIVLSKKAASIRNLDSTSSWLHGVAVRVALKAKSLAGERRTRERRVAEMTPSTTPGVQEALPQLRPVIDEELSALPDKYRAALVLCYLEGKTNEGAARAIGCPVGTMSRRLEKARDLLRDRLVGRGVAVTGALLVGLLLEKSAYAAEVPSALAASAAKVALLAAAGEVSVSAPVALLVKGALKTFFAAQMKIAVAAVLAVGLVGSAAGVVTYRVLRPEIVDDSSYSASDVLRLDRRLAELQPLASERKLDEIGWATDLLTAEKLAKEYGRPLFVVQHDGDLSTGRGDGGMSGMRANLLSDDRVISLLNRCFIPVYLSNDDFAPIGRATPAERNERIRIYKAALAAKFSAGDGAIYVVAPEGQVLGAMTVPRAEDPAQVLPLLERTRGREGAAFAKPVCQSRPPSHAPDDLVLHLVARYVNNSGAVEQTRGTYHEFPAENWLVFGRTEAARLLPREECRIGLEWTPAEDLASLILTHFYPVTEDLVRDDSARSKVERLSLRARLVSIRGGSMRARLEGDLRMSRYFHAVHPPTHGPMPVEAKVSGYVDFESSGRILSLKLTTDRATYGTSPFAVAVQSK
jgi:RNA polymerase sigma factor (sigma-70 family)